MCTATDILFSTTAFVYLIYSSTLPNTVTAAFVRFPWNGYSISAQTLDGLNIDAVLG